MESVTLILKVESGPCLFDTTLVALYLLLLAGDICENPGPETRYFGGETSNLLNIPVVISNRSNYSRPFNRPLTRNLVSIPIVNEQYRCARRHLRICCLNARSIKNKSADFACYANSTGADIFAITESWLPERDMAHKAEITLPGYKLLEQQRVGRKGGGIALLLNETINARKVDRVERRSFEFGEWILKYGSSKLRVIVIYCPPYSAARPVTSSVFLDEFSVYLESVVMSPEPLLINGDLNIHVNVSRDPDGSRFLELLTSMGLEQHVDKPTHISGHTLDLIITRCSDSLLGVRPITDYLISDLSVTVLCDLQLGKPAPKVKQVSYRKIKDIDREKLEAELSSSQLCQNTPDTLGSISAALSSPRASPRRDGWTRERPIVSVT